MEPTERPARRWMASAGRILGGLLALGLLLLGRFDWSPAARSYSIRAYLSSFYLVIPTLVALWGLSRSLWRGRVALAVVVATGLVFVLPYRWLGVERFHYYRHRPVAFVPDWLKEGVPTLRSNDNAWGQEAWEATRRKPPTDWRTSILIPPRAAEGVLQIVVGVLAMLGAVWVRRLGNTPLAAAGLALFTFMAVESWAHTSLSSPYSYVTHNYLPLQDNYWYVAYLIGDRQGAVNADVVVYHDLEEHFWGTPRSTNTMLLRRPYVSYVASQLTYFLNEYQVFTLVNLAGWALAVFCIYDIGRREVDEATARYAAILTACGPGFLMYVGQPAPYLAGYAGMAFAAWLTVRTMNGRRPPSIADWVTLAATLGLNLLVYDAFAWFSFVVGYAALRKCRLAPVLATLAGSTALYAGFIALQTRVLRLTIESANTAPLSEAASNLIGLVKGGQIPELYQLTLEFARLYSGGLAAAFFVVPAILALAGLCFPGSGRQRAFLVLLMAPSVLSVAFLCYGQATWSGSKLASMPRFTYSAFPAVYLLAGSAVSSLELALRTRGRPSLGRTLAWAALGASMVVANLDTLTGWPHLYYWFYWGTGGHFL